MPRTGRPKRSRDIECICRKCGQKFLKPDWAIRSGEGKFCSRTCYESAGPHRARPGRRIIPLIKACEECGREFEMGGRGRPPKKRQFCSASCAVKAKWRLGQISGGSLSGWRMEELDATEHPAMIQIAWAAGVYEGEGSASHDGIQLAQKDRWLCDRLRALFGGSIGHYDDAYGGHYRWRMTGSRARGFLMTIFAFLSPRRKDQIRAALTA